MDSTIFHRFADIEPQEMTPGFTGRIIHTESNTFNFLEIKAGSISEIHRHPHHQCLFVLEGEFELTVNGKATILTTGLFATLPGNVPHGGRAITDCKLLDVFNPVREDFK
jgi:quercetin dioxygenase-like cupin family protein